MPLAGNGADARRRRPGSGSASGPPGPHEVCSNGAVSSSRASADAVRRGLGPVLEFMRLLWATDHALRSRSKRMRRELGLTGPQRLVVRLVGRFPGISARELALLLRIHPSTLTGILQRLAAKRLIRREADPADARRTQLTLTELGRRRNVPAPCSVEAGMRRALSRVPKGRLESARSVLLEIVGELERDGVGSAEKPVTSASGR